jgi:hypothetical protein
VRKCVVLAVSAALLAPVALLAGCGQMGGPKSAGQPTAQAQSMQHMLADINQIRAFSYGGGDQASAQAAADDLVGWSGQIATLFPPGQASVDYVDMSPARAAGAPGAMSRTAVALQESIRTGDRALVSQRLLQTEQNGCGFCHRSQ